MSLHDDLDELADICEHMKPVGQWPGAKAIRALREAAELARRVEDAPCAVAGQSPGRFYYVGGSAPVEHGQRVRLVPDSPTPPT